MPRKNDRKPNLTLAPAPAPEPEPVPEKNPLDGKDVVITAEELASILNPPPAPAPAPNNFLVPVPFRGRILYVTQSTLQQNVIHFALLGLAVPLIDQVYFAAGIRLEVDGKQVWPDPADVAAPTSESENKTPPVEG